MNFLKFCCNMMRVFFQPEYANPPPGTIVDHTVTRFKYKDFFLVPQSVNQGTVTPTHFIVLKENPTAEGLDATAIQKLAYKLTHMYYNWPGTVRGTYIRIELFVLFLTQATNYFFSFF